MQIVATPIPTATAVTLGDDAAGAYIIDPPPIPVEKRQVQIEQLVLEARVFAIGLGNRQTSFSWTVARIHADQPTADAFVWGHAAGVPLNCSLAVNDPDGTAVATFSSAVIVEVACIEQTGLSTKFRYRVQGAVPA
ncbi:MAG TPA: hypothetical protein VN829_22290 [Dongiaceae bacterium]|nr:hypothetical protein [Dongiaceae bacterium]